jgi:hypothetical protein
VFFHENCVAPYTPIALLRNALTTKADQRYSILELLHFALMHNKHRQAGIAQVMQCAIEQLFMEACYAGIQLPMSLSVHSFAQYEDSVADSALSFAQNAFNRVEHFAWPNPTLNYFAAA